MEANDLNINGELKVDGNISVKKITSNGKLVIQRQDSSEEMDINGRVEGQQQLRS